MILTWTCALLLAAPLSSEGPAEELTNPLLELRDSLSLQSGADVPGVTIDGPDQDTATSAYKPDNDVMFQHRAPGHVSGRSSTRINVEETGESQAGGNGLGGHDETSEDTAIHFTPDRAPTPGGP